MFHRGIWNDTSGCVQGKTVVAVTSGANIPFDRLRVVAELAELGAGREAMLASTITGRPGSLREVSEIREHRSVDPM